MPNRQKNMVPNTKNISVAPKSVFTQKILEEEKLKKLKEMNEQRERQNSLNRRAQYGKLVKETHMPKT